MNIEAKDFEIRMSYSELWTLAFDVRNSLRHTLETHWINFQDSWQEHEKKRLAIIRTMFFALGRPDLYEESFEIANNVFRKHNEKTKVKVA
jgi:hypothetical protein